MSPNNDEIPAVLIEELLEPNIQTTSESEFEIEIESESHIPNQAPLSPQSIKLDPHQATPPKPLLELDLGQNEPSPLPEPDDEAIDISFEDDELPSPIPSPSAPITQVSVTSTPVSPAPVISAPATPTPVPTVPSTLKAKPAGPPRAPALDIDDLLADIDLSAPAPTRRAAQSQISPPTPVTNLDTTLDAKKPAPLSLNPNVAKIDLADEINTVFDLKPEPASSAKQPITADAVLKKPAAETLQPDFAIEFKAAGEPLHNETGDQELSLSTSAPSETILDEPDLSESSLDLEHADALAEEEPALALPLSDEEPAPVPAIDLNALVPSAETLATLQKIAGPSHNPKAAREALLKCLAQEPYNAKALPESRMLIIGFMRLMLKKGLTATEIADAVQDAMTES